MKKFLGVFLFMGLVYGVGGVKKSLLYTIRAGKMLRSSVAISSNFSHFAFVVLESKYQYVIYDGKAHKKYKGIGRATLHIVNDRLFYLARNDKGWFLVDNGKEGPVYEVIYSESFMVTDKGEYAFVAKKGNKWVVNINGNELNGYDGIMRDTIHISGNGFCFVVKIGNNWGVNFNGKLLGRYDFVVPESLELSPDGKHVVYFAFENGKRTVVLDGKKAGNYDEIFSEIHIIEGDTEEIERYGKHFHFTEDGVIFYARKDNKLLKVKLAY